MSEDGVRWDVDVLKLLIELFVGRGGLPSGVAEYRFDEKRKWRFDYAWPEKKIALEYEGGVFAHGWHSSIERYISDCEKYTEAAIQGWCVLRFTAATGYDEVVATVKRALASRETTKWP